MKRFGLSKKREYSEKEILEQLDKCAQEFMFPMLDNGHVYPIHSKLNAYRDEKRWALIIEVIGFSYRGGGHDGISNCLHIYGNCINMMPGIDNSSFLYLTDDSAEYLTFDEEYSEFLNPKAKTMLLRGKELSINHNREFYSNKGIDLVEENRIFVWEFMRGLVPEWNNELEATEQELNAKIPVDLPKILELTEWFHPDCAGMELPSQNETFVQIARVLETGKTEFYRPTKKPNNHWSNWPNGGNL
ncbi:DUF7003 family protein [Sanyastnella coralliicola]|uniref:DUF7003 family protein n=1 Tax=Sanyastnella coralliicola TaxID=3069118 RepID=UPI0027BA2938|nr:hypothetical protein [Longitalea sp. SCSIO 12813]